MNNDQLHFINKSIVLDFVWARRMASEDMMTKWLQECSQGIVRLDWRHHTGAIDYKDHIYK